jgi:hypothetical protein
MTIRRFASLLVGGAIALSACSSAPDEPGDLDDRYGEVETTSTSEPVEFTEEPYEFTGPDTIGGFEIQQNGQAEPYGDLYSLFPTSDFVWYGASAASAYPVEGICDENANEVVTLDELPLEIEGTVTLHPRYFQKTEFCGSEERYYGSYLMQDASGGVLVLRDGRVANFTFGDRVRLKVHALMKFFDSYAVVASVDEEVVERGGAVYYEEIDRDLNEGDIGKVVRVRRRVVSAPTSANFNEMCMVPINGDDDGCDPRCLDNDQCLAQRQQTVVSIDRELGQRQPEPIEEGQILEVTGPVVNSFGLRILVSRLGQLTFVEE